MSLVTQILQLLTNDIPFALDSVGGDGKVVRAACYWLDLVFYKTMHIVRKKVFEGFDVTNEPNEQTTSGGLHDIEETGRFK